MNKFEIERKSRKGNINKNIYIYFLLILLFIGVILAIVLPLTLINNNNNKNKLINTNWPIVHGTPQNSDSSVTNIDFSNSTNLNLAVFRGNPLAYGNPIAIPQGSQRDGDMSFWTSGYGLVYTGRIKKGEIIVDAEYDREISDPDDTFHGSYSFITSSKGNHPEYYYASFKNTIERFYYKNGEIKREVCNLDSIIEEGDNLLALNITKSGLIISQSRNGVVLSTNTRNILSEDEFIASNFNSIDLRNNRFFEDYSQFGLSNKNVGEGYEKNPFTKDEIVWKKQDDYRTLEETLWISNSLGIGPENSPYENYAYIPTCVGIVSIDCTALSLNKDWDDVVKDFFAVPRQLFVQSDRYENYYLLRLGPMGTGSSPTCFKINKENYMVITDGILPFGLCLYNLKGSKNKEPDCYDTIHFLENDLTTSEQSVAVYCNHNSVDIVVVNNYIGSGKVPITLRNYTNNLEINPRNIGALSGPIFKGNPITAAVGRVTAMNKILELATNYAANTGKNNFFNLASGEGIHNCNTFGVTSRGAKLYNYKGGQELKTIWTNSDVGAFTVIPTITPKYVFLSGIVYDKDKIPQKYRNDLEDLPVTNRLIGINRENGEIEVAKSLILTKGGLGKGLANMLSNVAYAGIGVFEHKNKKALVWGSLGGVISIMQ